MGPCAVLVALLPLAAAAASDDDCPHLGLLQVRARQVMSCRRWCLNAEKSWAEKCASGRCGGCLECAPGSAPGASTGCAHACGDDPLPWSKKCTWFECAACAPCSSGAADPPPDFGPAEPFSLQFAAPGEACVDAASPATSFSLATGAPFEVLLRLCSPGGGQIQGLAEGSEPAPAGLSFDARTGGLAWQPDFHQAGVHQLTLAAGGQHVAVALHVSAAGHNPDGLYVWPAGGSDSNDGSPSAPFASIAHAAAVAQPGGTVYIRGGTYVAHETIAVSASAETPILITRLPGERVRLTTRRHGSAFTVPEGSGGVTFRGLEVDGGASVNDHWEVLRTSWWRVDDGVQGGRNGFRLFGEHVVVEQCVIHDLHQKAIDITVGRYITARYNVIYNIGHSSLSGGAGIHRRWMADLEGDDSPAHYRYDFYGNLLFAVEQRIYSFIPWKQYCHMVIDEGKTIELDPCRDEAMKARIAHNLVLYGGVDHVRLKPTENLQIYNNAVMAEPGRSDPTPDGITAKGASTAFGGECVNHACNYGGVLGNLTFFNNLVHTDPGSRAIDLKDQFGPQGAPGRAAHNYHSGGGAARGLGDQGGRASVFRDAASGDFRSSEDLPEGVGVDPGILEHLFSMARGYGVTVAPSGWRHDHCRNVRTIIESAPAEHLSSPVVGPSGRFPGYTAYFFNATSDFYRGMCRCSTLEIVPPKDYFEKCI